MDKLSVRLIQARRAAQLTQSQLAKMAGMSQAAYQKLESGQSDRSRFISDIARVLGVSALWLTDGVGRRPIESGDNFEPATQPPPGMVPELSWVQAGEWTECGHVDADLDSATWHARPAGSGERTYVLRVVGDSMAPEYPPGRLIFVDPDRSAVSGDDVIALISDSGEATFKRYLEEPGSGSVLKALNPDWRNPYIPINGNCDIIGVIVADMRIR